MENKIRGYGPGFCPHPPMEKNEQTDSDLLETEITESEEISEPKEGLLESVETYMEEVTTQEETKKVDDTDSSEIMEEVELTEEEKEAIFLQTVSYEILTNKTEGTHYINVLGLLENIEPVPLLVIPESVNVIIDEN